MIPFYFLPMNPYWSPIVHGLTPYVPGEQPQLHNLIKLNTNENPYGPSPKVLVALQREINANLRLYPDPHANALATAVAAYYKLDRSQIFIGNGSDEVLAHIFMGLLKHEQPILFPDITYSFYPVYCQLYGIEFRTVPLNANFEIDVADYTHPDLPPNGGIIFPNPNAPTGRLLPLQAIEQLLTANSQSIVVIDEAYIDFGGESAIPLVRHFPNLLVVQTLSKSRNLAGLRVGFAIGHPELIEALERIKNSFNSYPLDRLAIAGATAAIEDCAYFDQTRHMIMRSRETLTKELAALKFEVLPSAANFVFVRHAMHDATMLSTILRSHGIIVRHFNQARIQQFLRITIGTDSQCQALVEVLRQALKQEVT